MSKLSLGSKSRKEGISYKNKESLSELDKWYWYTSSCIILLGLVFGIPLLDTVVFALLTSIFYMGVGLKEGKKNGKKNNKEALK